MVHCSVFMLLYNSARVINLVKSVNFKTQTSLSRSVEAVSENSAMAKILKSIFNSTERRKASHEGDDGEEKSETPPMDSRRQLSISRSGRMRQANKKRHTLTLELYGDAIDTDQVKRHTPVEYHVHSPASKTSPAALSGRNSRLGDDSEIEVIEPNSDTQVEHTFEASLEKKLKVLALESGPRSPDEEIDNAFEVIDKS